MGNACQRDDGRWVYSRITRYRGIVGVCIGNFTDALRHPGLQTLLATVVNEDSQRKID